MSSYFLPVWLFLLTVPVTRAKAAVPLPLKKQKRDSRWNDES
jgi:hypothetical protein